jgi:hypothetical protein
VGVDGLASHWHDSTWPHPFTACQRWVRLYNAEPDSPSFLGVLSCGGDGSTEPNSGAALVTFLNLTNTTLTFSANGITDTGSGGPFCLAVAPLNPNLIIKGAGAGSKTLALYWGYSGFAAGTKTTLWIAPVPSINVTRLTQECTEAGARPLS